MCLDNFYDNQKRIISLYSDIRGDKNEEMKGTVHYVFDGVMSFLQVRSNNNEIEEEYR